jgi:hypothetical protein
MQKGQKSQKECVKCKFLHQGMGENISSLRGGDLNCGFRPSPVFIFIKGKGAMKIVRTISGFPIFVLSNHTTFSYSNLCYSLFNESSGPVFLKACNGIRWK